jgi:hypothetical protein
MTNLEAIRQVMTKYNEYRALWIAKNGNDEGFDAWFSTQVGA